MKDFLEGIHTFNEARLMKDGNYCSIIVEGPRDVRIFNRLVDTQKCKIIPFKGKDNLCEIIALENFKDENKIIAIRDADCLRINKKKIIYEKCFLTDTHDMDTDILYYFKFKKLLSRLNVSGISEEKEQKLRQDALSQCKMIGLLRCYNDKNDFGFDFNDNSKNFKNFFMKKSKTLDFKKYVEKLKETPNTQNRENLEDFDKLLKELHEFGKSLNNNWDICQGHDVINFLFYFLPQYFSFSYKKMNINDYNKFERTIYELFTLEEFKKTKLYTKIREWQKKNGQYFEFIDKKKGASHSSRVILSARM